LKLKEKTKEFDNVKLENENYKNRITSLEELLEEHTQTNANANSYNIDLILNNFYQLFELQANSSISLVENIYQLINNSLSPKDIHIITLIRSLFNDLISKLKNMSLIEIPEEVLTREYKTSDLQQFFPQLNDINITEDNLNDFNNKTVYSEHDLSIIYEQDENSIYSDKSITSSKLNDNIISDNNDSILSDAKSKNLEVLEEENEKLNKELQVYKDKCINLQKENEAKKSEIQTKSKSLNHFKSLYCNNKYVIRQLKSALETLEEEKLNDKELEKEFKTYKQMYNSDRFEIMKHEYDDVLNENKQLHQRIEELSNKYWESNQKTMFALKECEMLKNTLLSKTQSDTSAGTIDNNVSLPNQKYDNIIDEVNNNNRSSSSVNSIENYDNGSDSHYVDNNINKSHDIIMDDKVGLISDEMNVEMNENINTNNDLSNNENSMQIDSRINNDTSNSEGVINNNDNSNIKDNDLDLNQNDIDNNSNDNHNSTIDSSTSSSSTNDSNLLDINNLNNNDHNNNNNDDSNNNDNNSNDTNNISNNNDNAKYNNDTNDTQNNTNNEDPNYNSNNNNNYDNDNGNDNKNENKSKDNNDENNNDNSEKLENTVTITDNNSDNLSDKSNDVSIVSSDPKTVQVDSYIFNDSMLKNQEISQLEFSQIIRRNDGLDNVYHSDEERIDNINIEEMLVADDTSKFFYENVSSIKDMATHEDALHQSDKDDKQSTDTNLDDLQIQPSEQKSVKDAISNLQTPKREEKNKDKNDNDHPISEENNLSYQNNMNDNDNKNIINQPFLLNNISLDEGIMELNNRITAGLDVNINEPIAIPNDNTNRRPFEVFENDYDIRGANRHDHPNIHHIEEEYLNELDRFRTAQDLKNYSKIEKEFMERLIQDLHSENVQLKEKVDSLHQTLNELKGQVHSSNLTNIHIEEELEKLERKNQNLSNLYQKYKDIGSNLYQEIQTLNQEWESTFKDNVNYMQEYKKRCDEKVIIVYKIFYFTIY